MLAEFETVFDLMLLQTGSSAALYEERPGMPLMPPQGHPVPTPKTRRSLLG